MLIVLGGLLGSGRRILADELALRYGLYHHDIDRKKLRWPPRVRGDRVRILQPRSDEERLGVYKSALTEFSMLSKMYPDVIVDEGFHRELPREYFLSHAKDYYDPVIFIWIDSDDRSVRERLGRRHKEGRLESVEGALRIRKKQMAIVQEPQPTVLRFNHTLSEEDPFSLLWEKIQESKGSS
jgi:predicted kinase